MNNPVCDKLIKDLKNRIDRLVSNAKDYLK